MSQDHDTGVRSRRQRGLWGDTIRLADYDAFYAVYDGQQWDGKPHPEDVRLVFNYLRVFIKKVASYLMGVPPQYRCTDATTSAPLPEVEQLLRAVASLNQLPALDLEQAQLASILGDGCYTIRWDAAAGLPRVTAVDPGSVRLRYRSDDRHTLLWLEQQYICYPGELAPQELARLASVPAADAQLKVCEYWTPTTWRREIDGQPVSAGANPYQAIPYIWWPNERAPGEFYGVSDLVDLVEPQRQLNARMSDLEQLLGLSGNPVTVTEGVANTEKLAVGPGAHWKLPAEARAYILNMLEGGVVNSHLAHITALYRTLHDLAELPRTSFGDTQGQAATSGVALELELQPLIHKLARKKAIWEDVLQQRARWIIRLATIAGQPLPALASIDIRIEWPPVIPSDRAALVQSEAQLVSSQIHSRQTAGRVLGDEDPAAELAQVIAEAARLGSAPVVAPPTPTNGG